MPTASINLKFEYEEQWNGMWNPSLYLTNIIRIIYNSHPSRRTAKFWNENVFFKFIDLFVPNEDYGKPILFFRHIFCINSSIEFHWIYFSCKLSKKVLQERQTCKYIKNYYSQYESKYTRGNNWFWHEKDFCWILLLHKLTAIIFLWYTRCRTFKSSKQTISPPNQSNNIFNHLKGNLKII